MRKISARHLLYIGSLLSFSAITALFITVSSSYAQDNNFLYLNGNVGVGVSPTQKLDVAGNIKTTGGIYAPGAASSFGTISIHGYKNAYAGLNFRDPANNADYGTYMSYTDGNATYQGFYKDSIGWRWLFSNGDLYPSYGTPNPGYYLGYRASWPGLYTNGDMAAGGRFFPGGQTSYHLAYWPAGAGLAINNNLSLGGALYPGNQGTYYLTTWSGGLYTVGNHLASGSFYPGGQGSYYLAGASSGLYTNNNMLIGGALYPGNQSNYSLSYNSGYSGLYTNGNLAAAGVIYTQYMIDSNNGNYIANPDGTSQFNILYRIQGFNGPEYDANNNGYYVDPNGTSQYSLLYRTYGFNGLEYDINNTAFYADPSNVTQNNWTYSNYYYSNITGSYFPHSNGWNYLRGASYAFNSTWYDESNAGYYLDPSATSQFYVQYRTYGFNGPEYDVNNGGYYVDPNAASSFNAVYTASGSLSGSDRRLKTDISPLTNSLAKINQLEGVNFNWKQDTALGEMPKDRQIGLIAQDVEKVLPELVQVEENGYRSLDYSKLTAVIVEGIKEQQKQLEEQKKKNESQDKEIQELKRELQEIKQSLSN